MVLAVLDGEPGWENGVDWNPDRMVNGEILGERQVSMPSSMGGSHLVFSSSRLMPSWHDDAAEHGICKVTCQKVLHKVTEGLLAGRTSHTIMVNHNPDHTVHKCWWLTKEKSQSYGGQCICECSFGMLSKHRNM
jgi:hypothetical protein